MVTSLTNYSDFTISTTTETNDTATRLNTGSFDSSWAYQSGASTAGDYLKYYINDVLVYTSSRFNSGTYYPAVQTDLNSEGVQWQLIEYTSDSITWKLVGKTGLATTSLVGVNDETAKADWNDLTAHFFIGVSNNVQIFEYDGTRYNVWTRSPATAVNIGDTFTINLGIAAPTGTRLPPPPIVLGGL